MPNPIQSETHSFRDAGLKPSEILLFYHPVSRSPFVDSPLVLLTKFLSIPGNDWREEPGTLKVLSSRSQQIIRIEHTILIYSPFQLDGLLIPRILTSNPGRIFSEEFYRGERALDVLESDQVIIDNYPGIIRQLRKRFEQQ